MPIDPRTGQTIIDPRVAALAPQTGPVYSPIQGIGRLAKAAALRKVLNDQQTEADQRQQASRDNIAKAMAILNGDTSGIVADNPVNTPSGSIEGPGGITGLDPNQRKRMAAQILMNNAETSGIGETLLLESFKEQEKPKRNIIEDANGRKRDADTGELIFPDVEVKAKDIMSPERVQQEKEIKAIDLDNAITKAIAIASAKLQLDENSEKGQLEKTILEGKAAETKINEEKQKMRQEGQAAKAAIVEGKIDEAIELTDQWFTTGFLGGLLNGVGGTDARSLRGVIDTIKGNLGFAELQAMRDASPTGGALGQVAVRELELLQSTIASLDQAQDNDVLKKNLLDVKKHVQNWKKAVDASALAPVNEQPKTNTNTNAKVIDFNDLP